MTNKAAIPQTNINHQNLDHTMRVQYIYNYKIKHPSNKIPNVLTYNTQMLAYLDGLSLSIAISSCTS